MIGVGRRGCMPHNLRGPGGPAHRRPSLHQLPLFQPGGWTGQVRAGGRQGALFGGSVRDADRLGKQIVNRGRSLTQGLSTGRIGNRFYSTIVCERFWTSAPNAIEVTTLTSRLGRADADRFLMPELDGRRGTTALASAVKRHVVIGDVEAHAVGEAADRALQRVVLEGL